MTPIRKPFNDVIKYIRYEAARPNPEIVVRLGKIGKEIIQDAYNTRDTGVDLGNQIDAYGYGVYFNKELVLQGYLDNNKSKNIQRMDHYSERKKKWVTGSGPDRKRHKQGRIEALSAIQNYVPDNDGYILYIVNAMWYSLIHEAHNLHIISQSTSKAQEMIRTELGVDATLDFFRYVYYK